MSCDIHALDGGGQYACMTNSESTPSATIEDEAAFLINNSIEEQMDRGVTNGDQIARAIHENTEHIEGETRAQINMYVEGMLDATQEGDVQDLDEGIGGQVDTNQKKTIAAETLKVHKNVEETLARTKETGDHEQYHLDNGHTEGIAHAEGKEEGVAVTVGGQDFDETAFIEGLTVEKTGDKFVSDTYRTYRQDFRTAINRAGVSIEAVEKAVKQKDLGLIDDNSRKPEFALAA